MSAGVLTETSRRVYDVVLCLRVVGGCAADWRCHQLSTGGLRMFDGELILNVVLLVASAVCLRYVLRHRDEF